MYKTTYEIVIALVDGSEPVPLADDGDATGLASAALAQAKACRDIDIYANGIGVIVPYHSIDYIAVTPTRTEVEDPTDDTCITDDDEEGD